MATAKKTETKKSEPAPDVLSMNIYQRLQSARMEFLESEIHKTGKNIHAKFLYFELEDIVPTAEELFTKYHLFLLPTFPGKALGRVINTDDPKEFVDFEIPLEFLSEPAKFRMNEIQGVGSMVTYYRRYLYMIILDIIDKDELDKQDGKKNLLPPSEDEDTPVKNTAPPTAEQRSEIKDEIISDTPASEEEINTLKKILNTLKNIDPEQNGFISEIAIKTQGFTVMTHDQCNNLIEVVKGIIASYDKGN